MHVVYAYSEDDELNAMSNIYDVIVINVTVRVSISYGVVVFIISMFN